MEIFLYAFSVMYSPGPVNVMGLNAGLTGQFRRTVGFFIGVGCAMFALFLIFGYTGEALISRSVLPYLALVGGLYTLYLAFKVFTSKVVLPGKAEPASAADKPLTFWNGFLIQALNPKGMMVVLPITTVMFPAAHVTGTGIALVSTLIALGGAGAPGIYSFLGAVLGKRITKESYFNFFNRLMGVALAVCAAFMLYDFYLHVQGV
ncbi:MULTISPECIES: LysE family translocator [unclassified Pseudomonas]|uniref:LysE family translocator n=1 Tax=unclassified Pseudomonas TaxID=196821 RepID=UPI000BCEB075|nr:MULTISPECIES: LysE family transporter [unclassified Pseudomonas]PVZ15399.1 threonine/homoserine/homoserine lactone efflux protein [Pseudomonas sp. URIL14HWK12:I12]PVZ24773.1 threonine/homoserine/homoserine lactone efflux protein [Pseudomonas sp. URIL14HWK12:I10]PVZ34619.1 threonine/homoserine/homoserine lactone efflux protein [Pseudomonas sp. URIL14HWK12:I11]SNZ08797.1 Threonine/homoserine/homoserine lactone efflux protein [Pseudomonas sp. URIL14HWK12:I9]